jgi:hypothetical protein
VCANVRGEVVFALMFACVVCFILGLILGLWVVWATGLVGLLALVGDIAWTIMAVARAKCAGESKRKFSRLPHA